LSGATSYVTGGKTLLRYCIYGISQSQTDVPEGLLGYADTPLEVVEVQGLSAVVSPLTGDLGGEASQLLEFYQSQRRVLAALGARSVLPARVGSSLSSRDAVAFMLHTHAESLTEQLEGLRGLAQFNLNVTWSLDGEIQRAAGTAEVVALRASLEARPEITILDQARVGELLAQQLEYERHRLMDRVLHAIETDLSEYGVVSRDNDATAFNLVLLSGWERREPLLAKLTALEGLAGRLEWQLSEALPVTAFRSLEVIEPSPADLERARFILRLPATAPLVPPQVQRAYKQLALEKHPDRRQNDPNAAEEMRELSWARDLLEVAYSGVGVRVQKSVSQ
jgi:Gas vesicle synthesis protein GvpL/GvpF/DnaJ domain